MSALLDEAQRVHRVAGLSDRMIVAATGAQPSPVRGWLAGRSEPIGMQIAALSLSDSDVLALIPAYHPIHTGIDPELLLLINDKAANGRMRSWAAFTHTAAKICGKIATERIDPAIARSTITQLGAAG